MNLHRLPLLLTLASLGACSVGPDFQRPASGLPDQWQRTSASTQASAVDRQWWQQLGDSTLTSLVERAARANLDLALAANRLEQSRIARDVTSGERLPEVGASASYTRQRNSAVSLSDPSGYSGRAPFELWGAALDASWEPDLWGRVGRQVEMADAEVQLTQAERDGVALSVTAETASDYLRLRGVQRQLAVTRQNLDIARQSRQLTQTRFDNGVTTNLDTANAAAQVATIEARLPLLEAREERLVNALSLLLDLPPQALADELKPSPQTLATAEPAPVPVGLPSELARRRPDIQRSEAALHRATAAIGVAKADFYPSVSLGARFGFESMNGSDLGAWNSRKWSYGPSLYLPIFQGGRLTGTLALREHQQQAAAIEYRRTVLAAWHEVDNAMTDYSAEQRHHQALAEAVRQNEQALATARERYAQGAIDFLNVLNVQQALLETQSALVISGTDVALDRVQLFKAVGGGWAQP